MCIRDSCANNDYDSSDSNYRRRLSRGPRQRCGHNHYRSASINNCAHDYHDNSRADNDNATSNDDDHNHDDYYDHHHNDGCAGRDGRFGWRRSARPQLT